jgi:hypothetical protein
MAIRRIHHRHRIATPAPHAVAPFRHLRLPPSGGGSKFVDLLGLTFAKRSRQHVYDIGFAATTRASN